MTDPIFPEPAASDYDEDGKLLASYLGKLDPVESFTGREVAAEENRIRAGWTVRPLESFIDETYGGDAVGEPLDQIVSDLICNLLHLCDAAKLGADATLQKALRAYGEEALLGRLDAPVLGPKIEVLHERDPDSSCDISVYLDGVLARTTEQSVDPGAGGSRADWAQHTANVEADETLTPAFRDRRRAIRASFVRCSIHGCLAHHGECRKCMVEESKRLRAEDQSRW
jgi:hypothetical protein